MSETPHFDKPQNAVYVDRDGRERFLFVDPAKPPSALRVPWFSHIAPIEERYDEYDRGWRFGQSLYQYAGRRLDGMHVYE